MIIIGIPHDRENYFMADGDLAFMLEQAGFLAKYLDDNYVKYFKLNNKLKKFLESKGALIDGK